MMTVQFEICYCGNEVQIRKCSACNADSQNSLHRFNFLLSELTRGNLVGVPFEPEDVHTFESI